MPSYLTKQENKISKEFQTKGFIVRNVASNIYIKKIQNFFFDFCIKELKLSKKLKPTQLLNNFHKVKLRKDLNLFRLKLINRMINSKQLKQFYYLAAKEYLDILVGNELVMQNRINLSIQLPNDESSLLAVHSDVWSGDSPFEVVVWIPLVNCYKTKSMYILPPKKNIKFSKKFKNISKKNSEEIFKYIKKDVKWINIKLGQILIFNQSLPHGNIANREKETRWSLNCRFKNIFTPYGDKKIGEFFEPITLRKISEIGMDYNLPKIK
jgi:sporadic carbohydrate cluster 2OG-Fe(II) oxygenase